MYIFFQMIINMTANVVGCKYFLHRHSCIFLYIDFHHMSNFCIVILEILHYNRTNSVYVHAHVEFYIKF